MIEVDQVLTGKNIKSIIKENGYNADILAEKLNVTVNAVYKWYRGESFPTIDNLINIALLLDKTVEELVIVKKGSRKGVENV